MSAMRDDAPVPPLPQLVLRPLRRRLHELAFRLRHAGEPAFDCPLCAYHGPFRTVRPATGPRAHAACARCGTLERHRLQYLVARQLFAGPDTARLRCLHFAPEAVFRPWFATLFARYETADISGIDVDHTVDLQSLPFAPASYDVVYASHVLEHVRDDAAAIAGIRRILAPGGVAILPVPVVGPRTVEYPAPNPHETLHVRAPGPDDFDRYRPHFARVDVHRSEDVPARFQPFVHEDRSGYPDERSPLRLPETGTRHPDFVPVCYV
jgi:SAM-dependent methyltransferase